MKNLPLQLLYDKLNTRSTNALKQEFNLQPQILDTLLKTPYWRLRHIPLFGPKSVKLVITALKQLAIEHGFISSEACDKYTCDVSFYDATRLGVYDVDTITPVVKTSNTTLLLKAVAIQAEIEAMKVENKEREKANLAWAYTSNDFFKQVQVLDDLIEESKKPK